MSRLEEILERNQRATPGPWRGQFLNPEHAVIWKLGEEGAACRLDRESKYNRHRDNTSADVDFIAGARTDIPFLLERIEHLQRENERLKAVMEYLPSHEAFTTSNVLELYRSWEKAGIVDQVVKKLHERDSQSDTLT